MTCNVLTSEKLDLLLRGAIAASERPALLAHLATPCEECLDLLESVEGKEILERIGYRAALEEREADRIFRAAVAQAAEAQRIFAPATSVAQLPRARWPRRARWAAGASLSLGAVVAAILLSVLPRHPVPADAGGRLKGTAAIPAATLVVLAARPGALDSIRLLPPGAKLGRDEVLLLRARISAPAFVYLVGIGESGPAVVLWPEKGEVVQSHPAGEFEIARGGDALSIDPRALGRVPQIALIASPKPLDPARLTQLPRGAQQIAAALPGCGVDVLQPEVEPP